MSITRSMRPKSKISIFSQVQPVEVYKSHSDDSSFFQCISISLLEFFVKFKSSPLILNNFYSYFKRLISPTQKYLIEKNLNSSILENYLNIISLLQNTSSVSLSSSYITYYAESSNPHCSIALEYSARFILAYLFKSNPDLELSILNGSPIEDYQQALSALASELLITITVEENKSLVVFQKNQGLKQANIFLMKEGASFSILYQSEVSEYLKNERIPIYISESYPFVTVPVQSEKDYYLNSKESTTTTEITVEEAQKTHKQNQELSVFIDQSSLINPQILIEESKNFSIASQMSINDENKSLRIPYRPAVMKFKSELDLSSGTPVNPSPLPGPEPKKRVPKCLKSFKLKARYFKKILIEIDKELESTSLLPNYNDFLSSKSLKRRVKKADIEEFLDRYLPCVLYKRSMLKKICTSIPSLIKSQPISEKKTWNLISCANVSFLESEIPQDKFINAIVQVLTYLNQKNTEKS